MLDAGSKHHTTFPKSEGNTLPLFFFETDESVHLHTRASNHGNPSYHAKHTKYDYDSAAASRESSSPPSSVNPSTSSLKDPAGPIDLAVGGELSEVSRVGMFIRIAMAMHPGDIHAVAVGGR